MVSIIKGGSIRMVTIMVRILTPLYIDTETRHIFSHIYEYTKDTLYRVSFGYSLCIFIYMAEYMAGFMWHSEGWSPCLGSLEDPWTLPTGLCANA